MRLIYFILGALIPIPVFYNIATHDFFLQNAFLTDYPVAMGVPVPIGLFAIILLGILGLFVNNTKTSKKKASDKAQLFVAILTGTGFLYIALNSIDFLRILSLVFPLLALFLLKTFISKLNLFKYTLKGYAAGMFLFLTAHALSIVIFMNLGVKNKILLFSSFYEYWIYQSLVSYSAVLSFMGCTLLIMVGATKNKIQKILFLMVILLTFFILGFGARKAVLLDLCLLLVSLGIVSGIGLLKKPCLHKGVIYIVVLIIPILGHLLFFTAFTERSLTYETAVDQRGGSYQIFWDYLTNANDVDILFGQGGHWGGYSNIFVEFIYRTGLIGFFLYFTAFLLIVKYIASAIFSNFKKIDQYTKVWLVFLILSIVASNSINMNIQLPYYVTNLVFISLYYLNRSSSQLNRERNSLDNQVSASCVHMG